MGNAYMKAVWTCLALLIPAGALAASDPPTNPREDPLSLTCELGITLALSRDYAAAESVFVSLLSRSHRDARALNNIGNLHLWRGDSELAIAFYRQAAAVDTSDPGILLNEATALMLMGDSEAASRQAGEGVRKAGGTGPAADLLGLHLAETVSGSRAGDRTRISREELVALLQAAVRAVPQDSTVAASGDSTGSGQRAPRLAWRSAGARGAGEADLDALVSWKR